MMTDNTTGFMAYLDGLDVLKVVQSLYISYQLEQGVLPLSYPHVYEAMDSNLVVSPNNDDPVLLPINALDAIMSRPAPADTRKDQLPITVDAATLRVLYTLARQKDTTVLLDNGLKLGIEYRNGEIVIVDADLIQRAIVDLSKPDFPL